MNIFLTGLFLNILTCLMLFLHWSLLSLYNFSQEDCIMKSKFTHEEKQAILDRYISKSESPTSIIKSVGISKSTFYKWLPNREWIVSIHRWIYGVLQLTTPSFEDSIQNAWTKRKRICYDLWNNRILLNGLVGFKSDTLISFVAKILIFMFCSPIKKTKMRPQKAA